MFLRPQAFSQFVLNFPPNGSYKIVLVNESVHFQTFFLNFWAVKHYFLMNYFLMQKTCLILLQKTELLIGNFLQDDGTIKVIYFS